MRAVPRPSHAALLVPLVPLVVSAVPVAAQAPGPWVAAPVSTSVTFAVSAQPADVDLDGDTDILSVGRQDGFRWHENLAGDGSMWSEHFVAALNQGWSVVAADVDDDGVVDAVTGATGVNGVVWHENAAGDGSTWTEHTVSSTSLSARGLCAADVDGDGDLDIVSGAEDTGAVTFHRNLTGDGTSWSEVVIGVNQATISVTTADLDGDDDLDVVSASTNDNRVMWYRNVEGTGTVWAGQPVTTTAEGAHGVDTADFDGDGDLDVVSASFQDDEVAWHRNRVAQNELWTQERINLTGGEFTSVAARDVDLDGDPDVLSAAFDFDNEPPFVAYPIRFHEHRPAETPKWKETPLYDVSAKARSVVFADVDGDCDWDVVFSETTNNSVDWVRNDAFSTDCNGNATADLCEILDGTLPDCNGNLFPDACDIARGVSRDRFALVLAPPAPPKLVFGGNGVPDECDAPFVQFPLPLTSAGGRTPAAPPGALVLPPGATAPLEIDAGPAHAGALFVLVTAAVDDPALAPGALGGTGVAASVELGVLDGAGRALVPLAVEAIDAVAPGGPTLLCAFAVFDEHGRVARTGYPVALEPAR
jgi:hypothetical protein